MSKWYRWEPRNYRWEPSLAGASKAFCKSSLRLQVIASDHAIRSQIPQTEITGHAKNLPTRGRFCVAVSVGTVTCWRKFLPNPADYSQINLFRPKGRRRFMAVSVGFEPTVRLHAHNFSRVAPSAARTRYRDQDYLLFRPARNRKTIDVP